MKRTRTRLRSIVMLFTTTLLLTQACKKTDQWPDECNVPPVPGCDAQTLLISPGNENSSSVHYPEPYKFYKTYGPNGLPNYMDAFVGPYWSYLQFKGAVNYKANRVYMLNANQDTILTAELNQCGQPLRAAMTSYAFSSLVTWKFEYRYDRKGRLLRVDWFFDQSGPAYKDVYVYDRYDNVIKIYNEIDPARKVLYTYNYSRPIKGGYYEQGIRHAIGTELLEFLGLLNTQPHHLLTRVDNRYDYPEYAWPYTDQVVNADGYLVAYRANLYDNAFIAIKAGLSWNCGKGGGQKY